MTTDPTSQVAGAAETELFLGADWFDPLEAGVRTRIRSFIEELLEAELEAALSRKRYARRSPPENGADGEEARPPVLGHRHGHRERTLMGTFGAVTVCVPRARLATPEGRTTEWRNTSLPAYQRMTRRAEAADCRRLSVRHQHAPGPPGAGRALRWSGRQGRGQPGLAQGEDGLGRLDPARPVGRADHPSHPGRHRRAGAARPQGDRDLAAGRARCAPGWAEGAPRGQKHGRRERGGLAGDPGRSHSP